MTKTNEQILTEFREKFKGQTAFSQAILGALEYRGFNDAGKYLDDTLAERVIPIIEPVLKEILEAKDREKEEARQAGRDEAVDLIVPYAEKARVDKQMINPDWLCTALKAARSPRV